MLERLGKTLRQGGWRGGVIAGLALLLGACDVDPEHRRPGRDMVQQGYAAAEAPESDRNVTPADVSPEATWDASPVTTVQAPPLDDAAYASPAMAHDDAPDASREDAMHNTDDNPGLPPEALETLIAHGWMDRVLSGLGVWVCVDTQMLYVLEGLEPIWQARIATATAGTGAIANSYQTPLGWHNVSEKFGDDAPWGQVFRARGATREIWQPGDDTEEDLVLTRILWLDGEEPGKNQGYNEAGQLVDSKRRYIYIHGTNGEAEIGTPSSHGCIRMYNDDVIEIYDMLPLGTPVLITETQ